MTSSENNSPEYLTKEDIIRMKEGLLNYPIYNSSSRNISVSYPIYEASDNGGWSKRKTYKGKKKNLVKKLSKIINGPYIPLHSTPTLIKPAPPQNDIVRQ